MHSDISSWVLTLLVHVLNSLLVRSELLVILQPALRHIAQCYISLLSDEGAQPNTKRHIFIIVKLYAVRIYSHSVD